MPILVKANALQIPETWRLNSEEWSEGLGVEVHLQREQAQVDTFSTSKHDHPGQVNWILLDHEASDDILAACEVLYRPALRCINNEVTEGPAYGIASVYCQPKHRNRGYATIMMRLVAKQLKSKMACALWSDIGPDFYARFGWKTFPSQAVVIDVKQQDSAPSLLHEDDLEAICDHDCKLLKTEMKGNSFCFLPTHDTIRWHHARAFYMLMVHQSEWQLPEADELRASLGIQLSPQSFAIWTPQFSQKERVLFILRVRYGTIDELAIMMKAAIQVAYRFKLLKVVLWDLPYATSLKDVLGGVTVEEVKTRTSSLSALMLNDEHAQTAEWLHNERYCWC